MDKNSKSAIILLSGGLDSVVSIAKTKSTIKMGLFFDYGQIPSKEEKKAALKIAKYYGFPLKVIKLKWLQKILSNGLSDSEKIFDIKNLNDEKELEKSMKSVWVPNRNALFINIAASYCEAFSIDKIIIGANKEEGKTFKDNSKEFIDNCNNLLKFSTNKNVEVEAPLISMNKNEIIKEALKNNAPLEKIYSCYKGDKKHCGKCESCLHLKKALEENNLKDLIKKLF